MDYMSLKERFRIPTYNDPSEIVLGEVDFDRSKCAKCGMCIKVCPGKALVMGEDGPVMGVYPDNQCMFCGCCSAICARDAVIMKRPYKWSYFYKVIEHGELMRPRLFGD